MEIVLTDPCQKTEAIKRGAELAQSLEIARVDAKRENRALVSVKLSAQESADLEGFASSTDRSVQLLVGDGVSIEIAN